MTQILAITFPIYGAIALGYLVVAKGWFAAAEMRTLGKYVLNIALPALLFNAVASRRIADVFQPDYMLAYGLGGLATIATAWILFTLRGTDPQRRALGVMGSTCPNNAFIGFPIMLLAFPAQAEIILALNLLVENILLVPLCLLLMEGASGNRQESLLRHIGAILFNVLKMPMVIGLLLGLAVSLVNVPLPAPFTRLTGMLAASASALSLVVIGGSLVGLPLHGNRGLAAQITMTKLLIHPGLVAGAALTLSALGWIALTPDFHSAAILSAAMPMFGIYTVLAQKQGLEGAASIAMLGATTTAFVTLNLFLLFLT
ncbi:AEC family transporter [Aliisedimentitalea scapharcae]|uniref:AEC family transporter n=1 Tax=Aliisedimentitalea scapharcae TaxID=1524259 RepID=A0ABZ2XVK4_9RHOB